MRVSRLAPLLALTLVFWGLIPCAASSFFDGEFLEENWEVTLTMVGNGGAATVVTEPAGGVPGAYRQFRIWVNPFAPGSDEARVFVLHRRIGSVYDPGIEGRIDFVDYAEDAILFCGSGQGQTTGPCLWQDGNVYFIGFPIGTPSSWTHLELTGQAEEDFVLVDPSRPEGFDPSVHPDFSSDGSPIEIGFWRGKGTWGAIYNTLAGLDNWRVSINGAADVEEADLATPATWIGCQPNPCSGVGSIRFRIGDAGPIALNIFDASGRRVGGTHCRHCGRGRHVLPLTAIDDGGSPLPSGVYLVRLDTPVASATTRMIVRHP